MSRPAAWTALLVLVLVAVVYPARAHEIRPGFLEITEFEDGRVRVFWKLPMRGGTEMPLQPVLSSGWLEDKEAVSAYGAGAKTMLWNIDAGTTPLLGQTVTISGLEATLTDVLLKVTLADGTQFTQLLRPESASIEISASPRACISPA